MMLFDEMKEARFI